MTLYNEIGFSRGERGEHFFLKSKYFPVSNVWHQEVDIFDLNNYSLLKSPETDMFNH